MLHAFRKYQKSVMGIVMAAVCVGLISSFGISLSSLFEPKKNLGVATVYDHEISPAEFEREVKRRVNYFREQLGAENFERFSAQLDFEGQARDAMINNLLLEHFAKQINLTAGPEAVRESLREIPYFQGAELTQESYKNFLYAAGLTGPELESIQKKQLIQEQLKSFFSSISLPTEAELRNVFKRENATYEFRYLTIESKDFENKVSTTENDNLNSFFSEHKENYRLPKTVRYSFVRFSPGDFKESVELHEEDILSAYEDRAHEFVEPKEFLLRKIFLKVEQKESSPLADLVKKESSEQLQSELTPKEKKRELAQSIVERLDAGEEFKKVARELSEDKETAPNGGELPWMTAKNSPLPPKQASAAFNLGVGEHSEIIEEENGFFLFYLEDIKEARQKPFEEVRALLEADLRSVDAPLYAQEKANSFYKKWSEKSDQTLADAAKETSLPVFSSNELLSPERDPQGAERGLTAKVMEFEQGNRELVDLNNTFYVVSVEEVKDSYIPELLEVKESVTKDFIKKEALNLAKQRAESLLKEALGKNEKEKKIPAKEVSKEDELTTLTKAHPVKGEKSIVDLAKQEKLELKSTTATTKASAGDELFSAPLLSELAFLLTDETPLLNEIFQAGEKIYIVELAKKTLPDENEFAKKREELSKKEQQAASGRLFAVLQDVLRNEATEKKKLIVNVEDKLPEPIVF